MKLTESSKSDKHSRIKVALIPILILLLVYVLTSSDKPAPVHPPAGRAHSSPARPPAAQAPVATEPQSITLPSGEQPTLSLSQILEHDPFRVLPTLKDAFLIREKELLSQSTENQADSSTSDINQPKENPELTQQLEEEKLNRIKENLAQQVISGILYGPESKAAIINAKVYQEGDLLEKGIRIDKISPEGVLFQIDPLSETVRK